MRYPALFVLSICVLPSSSTAQLIPNPVDRFEKLRWNMSIEELRATTKHDPLVISRDRKTGRISQKQGLIFFTRRETIFGEALTVTYRITAADSSLHSIIVTSFEHVNIPSSRGQRDSLWRRVEDRYGPTPQINESGVVRREWTLGRTRITCMRLDGKVGGVVLSYSPASAK